MGALNNAPTNAHSARPGIPARVALVHDYLTQFGGAERVLWALHELFPDAPVLSSVIDYDGLPADVDGWELKESFAGKIPGAAHLHRALFPLYPAIFRGFESALREAELVIVDSSAWAHHASVSDAATLVCYCHSPARFLYGDQDYLGPAGLPRGVRHVIEAAFAGLRRSDQRAARRVDRFIANSRNVALRIERTYGRRAPVIYPPVDVSRPVKSAGGRLPWYLTVSRIVPHKRVDLAVDACTRHGIPLKVVGTGRQLESLKRRAGSTIEFLGHQSDEQVANLMRQCRAMIMPGAEDFGISAVEAQAAGSPVIAFGAGGALESIVPGETGIFFHERTPGSLISAIEAYERRSWSEEACRQNALRFSKERFQAEMLEEIEAAVSGKRGGT